MVRSGSGEVSKVSSGLVEVSDGVASVVFSSEGLSLGTSVELGAYESR